MGRGHSEPRAAPPPPSAGIPSFCRDPHPMQSTGHCRVRVSVSWTDPNLILDEGTSVLAIFGIWGALWQESFLPSGVSSSIAGARRVAQRRGLAPTWVGAQPWLFCSSGFSGLLSGWAGPAKCWLFSLPTRSCHRALPRGCGHRDSNSSHSHTRGLPFEGGFFSGFSLSLFFFFFFFFSSFVFLGLLPRHMKFPG